MRSSILWLAWVQSETAASLMCDVPPIVRAFPSSVVPRFRRRGPQGGLPAAGSRPRCRWGSGRSCQHYAGSRSSHAFWHPERLLHQHPAHLTFSTSSHLSCSQCLLFIPDLVISAFAYWDWCRLVHVHPLIRTVSNALCSLASSNIRFPRGMWSRVLPIYLVATAVKVLRI
jgi:hypothetical protein